MSKARPGWIKPIVISHYAFGDKAVLLTHWMLLSHMCHHSVLHYRLCCCEGDTMTIPLLLSEILRMDELMDLKYNTLAQWLSSEIKLRSATAPGMVKHPQWIQTNNRTAE